MKSVASTGVWEIVTGVAAIITVLLALAAVIVAAIGLKFARDATNAARDTVILAKQARQDDELERLTHGVERVGGLVEDVFFQAVHGSPEYWKISRNRLREALVGLRDRLPVTVRLVDSAMTTDQAAADAKDARQEIEGELARLHAEKEA